MRRQVLRQASAVPLGVAIVSPKPTDIRIAEVVHGYEDYVYRAPYKFGGRVVDRVTLLNVHCRVTTRNGQTAWGLGSMTMGNMWAFPSTTMSYDSRRVSGGQPKRGIGDTILVEEKSLCRNPSFAAR